MHSNFLYIFVKSVPQELARHRTARLTLISRRGPRRRRRYPFSQKGRRYERRQNGSRQRLGGTRLPAADDADDETYFEKRHLANYDPLFSVTPDEARILIAMAREAINLFQDASEKQRVAFLTLLLFNLRKHI